MADVTLLFTDLVDAAGPVSELGDERAESARRAHFRLVREAANGTRGDRVKNLGDGLLVVFPSALDALSCAVAIQRAVGGREAADVPSARVGLHVGEPIRDEDDYFGTPVVVARRLCGSADGGQILASDVVRSLVGDRGTFDFGEPQAIAVGGSAEAIAASEVRWAPARPEPLALPSFLATYRQPFVGRSQELEQLRGHWERARQGRLEVVLLAGEPGIGKTRLATELARSLHGGGVGCTVLFGRCYEEALLPFQPFVEALRHFVVSASADQLPAPTAPGLTQLARLVPELEGRLPGLPSPVTVEADTERYLLFEAVVSLLDHASRAAPVLLVLDDLHWADRPTLLMLRHVVRGAGRSRLLLLGAYRETEVSRGHPLAEAIAGLRRDHGLAQLQLRGLNEDDLADLVGARSGQSSTARFARALHRETEGNPLFAGELFDHLAESGAITETDGLVDADPSDARLGVPEGIRELIGRRLARLAEPASAVLSLAAVIGREFSLELLEELGPAGGDQLVDVLEHAIQAGLVAEVPGAVGRYTFSHALVRHAVYADLAATRRVRLHGRVAGALEENGAKAGPVLRELARHFSAAGDASKALTYAAAAGAWALEQLAYEEAADQYERALGALEAAGGDDERRRAELLLALGEARSMAGDTASGKEAFVEVAAMARRLGAADLLAGAALGYGKAGVTASISDTAVVTLLEHALELLEPGDTPLRAKLLARLAAELYFSSEERRRDELSAEAVEVARRVGDPDALGDALSARHYALWRPERLDDRLEVAAELLEVAESRDNAELALQGHRWHLIDLLELGEMQAADRALAAHATLAEQLRQPMYRWWTGVFSAMRALFEGRFREGGRLAQEAFQIGQHANEGAIQFFGLQTSLVLREQGRLAGSEPMARTMVEQFPAVPAWRCALALLYAELGKVEQAREVFELFVDDELSELPRDLGWLPALVTLADVCRVVDDPERAEGLYDLLLPYGARNVVVGAAVLCYGSAERSLGVLATILGRFDDAAGHFERATRANRSMGARPWLARTWLDHARMILRRGEPDDERRAQELLTESRQLARDMGMASVERAVAEIASTA